MHRLRDVIANDVSNLELPALAETRARLAGERTRLLREWAEVDQRISLWNRIVFFRDTPDEDRLQALDALIGTLDDRAREVDAAIDKTIVTLAARFPPFAIARDIQRCFALAHDGLEVAAQRAGRVAEKADITHALSAIADRVADAWLPEFDPGVLQALLLDRGECERIAQVVAREDDLIDDDANGWCPARTELLAPLVARRLLASDFFAVQTQHAEADAERHRLRADWDEKAESVTWREKLNVFSLSPAELARNSAAAAWRAIHVDCERLYERERELFQDGLRAFPPLDLYHATLAGLGVVSLLGTAREPVVKPNGTIEWRRVVVHGPLLIAALRRIEGSFDAAFPEFPRPDKLVAEARRVSGSIEPLAMYPAVVAELCDRLDDGHAATLIARAMAHATLRGDVRVRLTHVKSKISLWDRLVFWHRTSEEAEAKRLRARDEWNADWLAHFSAALIDEAMRLGATMGPFAIRDRMVPAIEAVRALKTDSGESSSPRACPVHGREEALAALAAVRAVIASFHGEHGTRGAIIAEVREAIERLASDGTEAPTYSDPEPVLTRLEHPALVALLVEQLRSTEFADRCRDWDAVDVERRAVGVERDAFAAKIAFWDRLNIFRTTPDEEARNELSREFATLSRTQRENAACIDALLSKALEVYPPFAFVCQLPEIEAAVENVRAVCWSRTVEVGSGSNQRTETRYYCTLNGHGEAVSAMERWAATFARLFGELPGYREMVELWQLRGWGGSTANLTGRGIAEDDDGDRVRVPGAR